MSRLAVVFTVVGTPAPQGDKSAVLIAGKPRLIEGRRNSGRDRHRNWRAAVADAARTQAGICGRLDGPLHLDVQFRYPMPPSRPRRVQAIGTAWKTTAHDLDKLLRALGDGLKEGGLIVDDARLARITASKVETTSWSGAVITLGVLPDHEGGEPS